MSRPKSTKYALFQDDALYQDSFDLVKVKLKLGADPNFICRDISSSRRTPLLHAIAENFIHVVKIVKLLIRTGLIDINARDSLGNTALLLACRHLSVDVCEKVIGILFRQPDLNLNLENNNRENALMILIERKVLKAMQRFTKDDRVNINEARNGTNPLHQIVQNVDFRLLSCLLESNKLDINFVIDYETPIEVAQKKLSNTTLEMKDEILAVTRTLAQDSRLDRNVVGSDGMTPLIRAIVTKDTDTVIALLESVDTDPNIRTGKILEQNIDSNGEKVQTYKVGPYYDMRAIEIAQKLSIDNTGDLKNIKQALVLSKKTQINCRGTDKSTTLIRALKAKDIDLIDILLTLNDLDPNIGMHVRTIRKNGSSQALEILPIEIAQNNLFNRTDIKQYKQHEDILFKLIESKKLNIEARGSDGMTTLIRAISHKNLEIVDILLNRDDIDPNHVMITNQAKLDKSVKKIKSSFIRTFKRLALLRNRYIEKTPIEVAQNLFSKEEEGIMKNIVLGIISHNRFNPNSVGSDGLTPMVRAISVQNIEIITSLMKLENIKPDLKTCNGVTPLYMAVDKNMIDVVKMLLQHKEINPNILVNEETPLHRSHYNGNKEISLELLRHPDTDGGIPDKTGKSVAVLSKDLDILNVILGDDYDTD